MTLQAGSRTSGGCLARVAADRLHELAAVGERQVDRIGDAVAPHVDEQTRLRRRAGRSPSRR
jgi:hypothetical protein